MDLLAGESRTLSQPSLLFREHEDEREGGESHEMAAVMIDKLLPPPPCQARLS
jgi:hypothetical protein